jgi:hypothetical protein
MVKCGDLPAGVRVGRLLYWDERVLAAWHEKAFAGHREYEAA